MDVEDAGYFLGTLAILAGSLWLQSVTGICVAGLLMAFPAALALIRGGPPQPPKGA